jgi:hypothetical protein
MTDETFSMVLVVSALGAMLLTLAIGVVFPGRLRARLDAPNTGDSCIACSSRDVTSLAPMVYRCRACGHEGGDGWAAWREAQRNASFEAWSPARRRRSAARDLVQARTLLVAGLGDLERASHETMSTVSDVLTWERSETWAATKGAGLGRLLEAQGWIRDAVAKLGTPLGDGVEAAIHEEADCAELIARGQALLADAKAGLEALRRSTGAEAPARRRAPPTG